MLEPFTLTVPVDDPYRGLGVEVAGRYAELMGGTKADGTALSDALTEAIADLVASAGSADAVELAFRPGARGIEVNVTCGGQTAVVSHPLLASKK